MGAFFVPVAVLVSYAQPDSSKAQVSVSYCSISWAAMAIALSYSGRYVPSCFMLFRKASV